MALRLPCRSASLAHAWCPAAATRSLAASADGSSAARAHWPANVRERAPSLTWGRRARPWGRPGPDGDRRPRRPRCPNYVPDLQSKRLSDGKGGRDEEEDDDDDDDFPMVVEEDDPYWPEEDPDGEGVGFRISSFFDDAKIMDVNEDGTTTESEELNLKWAAEQYQWVVREITSAEWELEARENPTPLIFLAFERYGPSGLECWHLLEELEKVVRTIIDSRKYPIRAVKLDVSSEPDVGAALKIRALPCLLFINGGKLLYRLYGMNTEKDILAIASHLFYHSARPECMDEVDAAHKVIDVSSSG